jgi:hypothetical protein
MKSIPFDPQTDLAPVPFGLAHLELAREMKSRGLQWKPHVGCFVWDHQETIEAPSPFPRRIYFILSLPRFVDIFGSVDNAAEKLVWLPTWHQARLLAASLGIDPERVAGLFRSDSVPAPGQELLGLYRLLLSAI